MLTFIVTLNWTDQGIRSVKEALSGNRSCYHENQ